MFPNHVPGVVPGTNVQEHGWEIASATVLGSELKDSEELDMWVLGTFGLDKLSHRPCGI